MVSFYRFLACLLLSSPFGPALASLRQSRLHQLQPSFERATASSKSSKQQFTHVHDAFSSFGLASLQDLQAAGPMGGMFHVRGVLGGGQGIVDDYNKRVSQATGQPWVGPAMRGAAGSSLLQQQWDIQLNPQAKLQNRGSGSFGTVFQAETRDSSGKATESVAIKVFAVKNSAASKRGTGVKPAQLSSLGMGATIDLPALQESIRKGNKDFVTEFKMYMRLQEGGDYNAKGKPYIVHLKGVMFDPGMRCDPISSRSEADVLRSMLTPWEFADAVEYKNGPTQGCKYRDLKALVLEFCSGGDGTKGYEMDTFGAQHTVVSQWEKGLSYMHGLKLVHGDFKPANTLLCGPNGDQGKVMDFGMTSEISASEKVKCQGTPGYMAPELCCTTRPPLHKGVDWYALGASALKLLTQRQYQLMQYPTQVLLENAVAKCIEDYYGIFDLDDPDATFDPDMLKPTIVAEHSTQISRTADTELYGPHWNLLAMTLMNLKCGYLGPQDNNQDTFLHHRHQQLNLVLCSGDADEFSDLVKKGSIGKTGFKKSRKFVRRHCSIQVEKNGILETVSGNLLAYYETNKNHPWVLKGGVFLQENHVSQITEKRSLILRKITHNLALEVIKLIEVKVERVTLGFKLPGAHDAGQPAQPATSTLNVFFDGKNALDTFHDWAASPMTN